MATTHQEIVKVWIAPGCIVCDACESDCPEVFDVQEDTCIIKPEAQKSEFTRPLTPSIIVAAEGCPVEVIKFETIEVEGEAPWQAQAAAGAGAPAAGAGGHAAPAKKAGWEPPAGPPEPQWRKLLSTAAATARANAPATETPEAPAEPLSVPTKPTSEAIAAALPPQAPIDALDATMIGVGYAKPRPGAEERIRRKASLASLAEATRREINLALVVGWGALAAAVGSFAHMCQAFLIPRLTKEPNPTMRAGKLADYPEPGVYEQFKGNGFWIVHLNDGKLVAVSTTCTHLGCIPNWLKSDEKFKCPCHGSGFSVEGVNFEGPAPRPLERYAILLDGDNVIVDKSKKYREELGQWIDPLASVTV